MAKTDALPHVPSAQARALDVKIALFEALIEEGISKRRIEERLQRLEARDAAVDFRRENGLMKDAAANKATGKARGRGPAWRASARVEDAWLF